MEEEIQKSIEELVDNIALLMADSKSIKHEQPQQAEKLMQNALKLALKGYKLDKLRFEIELVDIYCCLGDHYRRSEGGSLDKAMEYYKKVIYYCEHSESIKDEELASDYISLAADLIFGFANIFFLAERYKEAIPLFSKALVFQKQMLKFEKMKYQEFIAKTFYKIGYSYWHTGEIRDKKLAERALLAHIEAYEYLYEKDKSERLLELYAMSHHNIGIFYKEGQSWDNAIKSIEQAHSLFKELQKTDETAITVLEFEEKLLKEIKEKIK
ncbi:hypothetical protein [Bacteroides sp.]|uniref:hypothetical protein n=1 Tax=Bacteroides sp. TaxID=29523 RepID=UPI00262604BF|nr:hypothetical protein [Bacteroides sp.]